MPCCAMGTGATGLHSLFQIRSEESEEIGTVREHSRAKAPRREERPDGLLRTLRIAAALRLCEPCTWALAALLAVLMGAPVLAIGQGQPPRIIDCHVHYNGE